MRRNFQKNYKGENMILEIQTLEDFETALSKLQPGQVAEVTYSTYDILFPPGEPDELARERAYNLAKKLDCTIQNQPAMQRILFLKSDQSIAG
jgi:hypothetical protein